VVDQWYCPEHAFFKLRADDGNIYILRHETSLPNEEWELGSFRQTKAANRLALGLTSMEQSDARVLYQAERLE
jgi:hypothetical protein